MAYYLIGYLAQSQKSPNTALLCGNDVCRSPVDYLIEMQKRLGDDWLISINVCCRVSRREWKRYNEYILARSKSNNVRANDV